MTEGTLLELVKQGDPSAIATLLNRYLQPRGITVRATLRDRCLHLLLESAQVPDRQAMVTYLRRSVEGLRNVMRQDAEEFETVTVYGRQSGERVPAWTEILELSAPSGGDSGGMVGAAAAAGAGAGFVAANPPEEGFGTATQPIGVSRDRGQNGGLNGVPSGLASGSGTGGGNGTEMAFAPEYELGLEGSSSTSSTLGATPPSASETQLRETKSTSRQGCLAIGLLSTLVLLLLGYGGYMVWVIQDQQKQIGQAQTLAASAMDVNRITDLEALKQAQQSLKDAATVLSAVKDIPGSAYPQAEAQLAEVNSKLKAVEERLKREEQAKASLEDAKKLASEAAQLSSKPGADLKTHQEAEGKWLAALNFLASIPSESFVASEADVLLNDYRNSFLSARKTVVDMGGEGQPLPSMIGPDGKPIVSNSPEAMSQYK